jgi:hypothetical protein
MHRLCQRTLAGEIGGQRIIQQIGQPRLGPESGEGVLDGGDRMFQGVDQRDAHAAASSG